MSKTDLYDTHADAHDELSERDLRPQSFAEVIGRAKEKRAISVMIEAAKIRNKSLDHILFYGPPGMGKTTMASTIAEAYGVKMHITSGPAIEKQGDLATLLHRLEANSVVFIDEIHRLKINIEEVLYPAMEDGVVDITVGSGTTVKHLRIDLPPFTLIGATTQLSMVSNPLRDRFGAVFHMDFYTLEEIVEIVQQKAKFLKMAIADDAAIELAKRSRKTARVAVRLVKRAHDLMLVRGAKMLTMPLVDELAALLAIDAAGLDAISRKYLHVLEGSAREGTHLPVGLTNLAAQLGEEESTLELTVEPYLLREGYIYKTPRGRIISPLGRTLV